jgi:hypothetical protein
MDPTVDGYEVYNAFGVLTNEVNLNPSPFVTRGAAICGVYTTAPLPSEEVVAGCAASLGLTKWRACIETDVHSYIHAQM